MSEELTVEEKLRLAVLRYLEALTLSAAVILLEGHLTIKRAAYTNALQQIRGKYTEEQLQQTIQEASAPTEYKPLFAVPGMTIEVKLTGDVSLPELLRSLEEPPSQPTSL